jgi:hypothetical protein
MFEGWLKKIFGTLKLYWQHVCMVVLVTLWIIFVVPKAVTFTDVQSAFKDLALLVMLLAFGYSAARLVEQGLNGKKKNGDGNNA